MLIYRKKQRKQHLQRGSFPLFICLCTTKVNGSDIVPHPRLLYLNIAPLACVFSQPGYPFPLRPFLQATGYHVVEGYPAFPIPPV